MILIDQEEIIKIAAHFFCRIHAGINVKFIPIRKCRENTRQHRCLNLGCDIQFCPHTLFFCSYFCQMVDVVIDLHFHGFDGFAQLLNLIPGMDIELGDGCLRLFGTLLVFDKQRGCLRQTFDRNKQDAVDAGEDQKTDHNRNANQHQTEILQKFLAVFHNVIHGNVNAGSSYHFTILVIDSGARGTQPAIFFIICYICREIIISFFHFSGIALLKRITGSDRTHICIKRTVYQIYTIIGFHIHISDVNGIYLICLTDLLKQLQCAFVLRQFFHRLITCIIFLPLLFIKIFKIRHTSIFLTDIPVNLHNGIADHCHILRVNGNSFRFCQIHRHRFVLVIDCSGIYIVADRHRHDHQQQCRHKSRSHSLDF